MGLLNHINVIIKLQELIEQEFSPNSLVRLFQLIKYKIINENRKHIQSLAVLLYNSFSIYKNHVAIKINNNTISYAKLNEKQ